MSAAVGEMVIPLVLGKVFDYLGPTSFLAQSGILCFAAIGAYLAILVMGKELKLDHARKQEGELQKHF